MAHHRQPLVLVGHVHGANVMDVKRRAKEHLGVVVGAVEGRRASVEVVGVVGAELMSWQILQTPSNPRQTARRGHFGELLVLCS